MEQAMSDDHDNDSPPPAGAVAAKPARMAVPPDSEPGLETDGRGNVIALARRTKEDRDKARGKPA
jgi:hypothetical protein